MTQAEKQAINKLTEIKGIGEVKGNIYKDF